MKKYVFLAAAVVLIYFFQSFFLAEGGIGADSLSYFGIASDLPEIKTNLFPLGFPVLLKIYESIFGDYFWAAKMINISFVIIILIFSYVKKFYFKETVLLFTGKTLFFAFNIVSSEGFFVFLLYFLVYIFHQKLTDKIRSEFFLIFASVLMISLFTVRYSGIYIYLGIGVFYISMLLKRKVFSFKGDLFKFLVISGLGILAYLLFNYSSFGSLTGEHLRGAPAHYQLIYIVRDLLGVTNVIDPFIGLKPSSNSFASLTFQVAVLVVDLILLFYIIRLYRRKKGVIQREFHYFLWIVAGVYTVTLFISGYFQQIEEMNVRMLAAANFCLFFSFLIIYYKNLESDRLIFRTGCFFLLFLMAYSLKSPADYLKNKAVIAAQMPKFSSKKYLFDDEQHQNKITTYQIPLLKKSFNYQHTNSQAGFIKQSIAGTINPQIKWLKYDTIADKSTVLYTSQLILK